MTEEKPLLTEVTIDDHTFKIGDRMSGRPEKKVVVNGTLEEIGRKLLKIKVGRTHYYLSRSQIDVKLSLIIPNKSIFIKSRKK